MYFSQLRKETIRGMFLGSKSRQLPAVSSWTAQITHLNPWKLQSFLKINSRLKHSFRSYSPSISVVSIHLACDSVGRRIPASPIPSCYCRHLFKGLIRGSAQKTLLGKSLPERQGGLPTLPQPLCLRLQEVTRTYFGMLIQVGVLLSRLQHLLQVELTIGHKL